MITIGCEIVAVVVVVVVVVEMEERLQHHPDMSNFIHFRVLGRDV